jgi:hypothetical protein
MFDARQELAVLNNVYWYCAMFRAHRCAYAIDDLMWSSEAVPPPFHSNLVVLSPVVDLQRVRARLTGLDDALSPAGFSLKDSHARLDLADDGYEVLFDANWIWREPCGVRTASETGAWTVLTSPEQLEAWEEAWWGDARNTLAGPTTRQFPASLLESPHHRFLARWDGKTVVAGAIANRSPGAVGLSNTFQRDALVFDDWAGLLQCVGDPFPGVPLVGYERGAALDAAMAAGFVPTGPLRIWQRAPRQA